MAPEAGGNVFRPNGVSEKLAETVISMWRNGDE